MAWPPIPQTLVSSPFPVNFGYTYLQVSNTQSVATPTNFQQYIQLPPQLSLNSWPLRFFADPALTQPLYAWYETPTTAWVLLPNGIPANSSINIYFNAFLNYLSGSTSPTLYWTRIRAYPPNGIQPSIALV